MSPVDVAIQAPLFRKSIDQDFREFHERNPQVLKTLVRLARQARAAGKEHVGIGLLWEVMRWEMMLSIEGADTFKLNNNYRSRYARWIDKEYPDLAGLFQTRALRTP